MRISLVYTSLPDSLLIAWGYHTTITQPKGTLFTDTSRRGTPGDNHGNSGYIGHKTLEAKVFEEVFHGAIWPRILHATRLLY